MVRREIAEFENFAKKTHPSETRPVELLDGENVNEAVYRLGENVENTVEGSFRLRKVEVRK